jgi:hypothetical protein
MLHSCILDLTSVDALRGRVDRPVILEWENALNCRFLDRAAKSLPELVSQFRECAGSTARPSRPMKAKRKS